MLKIENKEGKLCDHGCGQVAHYMNGSGRLCCSERFYDCPGYKARQSRDSKSRPPSVPKGTILKDKSGYCKICGKFHDGRYGCGDYCSPECSHIASTLHTDKKSTYDKISKTLKQRTPEQVLEVSTKAIVTYNKNHPDHPKNLPQESYIVKNSVGKIVVKKERHRCKICGQIECPDYDACLHMKKLKLDKFSSIMNLSKLGTIDIYLEYEKLKRFIYDLYVNQKKSSPEIAKILNVNWVSVMFLLQKFEIQKRTRSEIGINQFLSHPEIYKRNSYVGYHCGYHTSWDGKKFWYRSSHELDYAKLLDKAMVSYEVESIRMLYWSRIKNRNSVLISDFYLPETNTIVEVKSSFTYSKEDWEDRLKVLEPAGYNCKLLYEHKWYSHDNLPETVSGQHIWDLN